MRSLPGQVHDRVLTRDRAAHHVLVGDVAEHLAARQPREPPLEDRDLVTAVGQRPCGAPSQHPAGAGHEDPHRWFTCRSPAPRPGRRATRARSTVVYSLHDNHAVALLDQAVYHREHRRLGAVDPRAEAR